MGAARKMRKLQQEKDAVRVENTWLREALAKALGTKTGATESRHISDVSAGGTLSAKSASSAFGGVDLEVEGAVGSEAGTQVGDSEAQERKEQAAEATGDGSVHEASAAVVVADTNPKSNSGGRCLEEPAQCSGDPAIDVDTALPQQSEQDRDRPQGLRGFLCSLRRAASFLRSALASVLRRVGGAVRFWKR